MRIRLPVARLASVLLFALLCAIVAGWALQLLAPRPPIAPSGAVAQALPPPDLGSAARLFGAPPAAAASGPAFEQPSNITVAGIVAAGARSVALLAVDGRPPKAFGVGESVADGMKVASVSAEGVEIDANGRRMRLAAPARASLDVLTSGPQRGGATPGAGAPPPPARPLPPAGSAAPMPPAFAPAAGAPPPDGTPATAAVSVAPPQGVVAPGMPGYVPPPGATGAGPQ